MAQLKWPALMPQLQLEVPAALRLCYARRVAAACQALYPQQRRVLAFSRAVQCHSLTHCT